MTTLLKGDLVQLKKLIGDDSDLPVYRHPLDASMWSPIYMKQGTYGVYVGHAAGQDGLRYSILMIEGRTYKMWNPWVQKVDTDEEG